ncbi:MAG: hypothetical protein H0V89_01140, partial [Deltaproteobacteria bacterium]|nr:hypothetical protein [Deltaproteobacteria bacterium]
TALALAWQAPLDEGLGTGDVAWRQANLARCEVTRRTASPGGPTAVVVHTFDDEGRRAQTAEDRRADGVMDVLWTHRWQSTHAVLSEASALGGQVMHAQERREWEGPRLLHVAVSSEEWSEGTGFAEQSDERFVWSRDRIVRTEGLDGEITWRWSADGLTAQLEAPDGATWARAYDASRRLVQEEASRPLNGGVRQIERSSWTYGDRGPVARTVLDERGGAVSVTTWTYTCPAGSIKTQ